MDRLTRHELKTDKFAEEVGHTVEFFGQHRAQAIRIGGIALAVLLVAGGVYYYTQSRNAARTEALYVALQTFNARVMQEAPPEGMKAFTSQAAKDQAVQKEFSDLIAKYPGTEQAAVATYLLGTDAADKGKLAEAERYLKQAADEGGKNFDSLGKLALAQVYAAQGKTADAEKILRDLMNNSTDLVSKAQATIALARVIAKTKPDEARKLLEPLRTDPGAVSRVAISAMADLGLAK